MKRLLVSTFIALSICASAFAEEIKPTRADFKISLEVRYVSRQEAWTYCKSLGLWPDIHTMPRRRVGCNLFYQDKKLCVVVTPAPTRVDDDATTNLGHELDHCLRGKYHD